MKNCLKNALRHAIIATVFMYGNTLYAADDMIQELSNDEYSACGAVMCLAAWADECSDYLDPFFAIEVFTNFPPTYNPLETLDVREIFLSICQGASKELINSVNTSRRGGHQTSGVFDLDGNELSFREVYIIERENDITILTEDDYN